MALKQVEVVSICVMPQDLMAEKPSFNDESIDAGTSCHGIEHWHHSPPRLFGEITRVLKLSGFSIIGCPNTINLRKLLWVFLGRTNLCALDDWYYAGDPVFREHGREPTVWELKRLLEGKRFVIRPVAGRNFLVQESVVMGNTPRVRHSTYRRCLFVLNPILRIWPTLCSGIHTVGRNLKGAKGETNAT
jgi:SAM-dependent methyltransferase